MKVPRPRNAIIEGFGFLSQQQGFQLLECRLLLLRGDGRQEVGLLDVLVDQFRILREIAFEQI